MIDPQHPLMLDHKIGGLGEGGGGERERERERDTHTHTHTWFERKLNKI